MPRYMLLIAEAEAGPDEVQVGGADWAPGKPLFDEIAAMHGSFAAEVTAANATIVAGEALLPLSTATFLRNTRSSDVMVVDNPAPDVKETLGGFYLIDAPDDSTARALAERCPAPGGYIVLRPVFDFSSLPEAAGAG